MENTNEKTVAGNVLLIKEDCRLQLEGYVVKWKKLEKKSSGKWKKQDDWIWVTTRRWKALQFYKREDIDKPVEYRTPRRKRWVRKWKGVSPISTTTWKHLTPKPKTNG